MSIVMGHGSVYIDGYGIICSTNLGLSNCGGEFNRCSWSNFYVLTYKQDL